MSSNTWIRMVSFVTVALFSAGATANGFEGNGIIDEVNYGQSLIRVGDEIFHLPINTTTEGQPAISQVQPGYQIGFSGEIGTPYPVITSIYIYPESVQRVEMGSEQ